MNEPQHPAIEYHPPEPAPVPENNHLRPNWSVFALLFGVSILVIVLFLFTTKDSRSANNLDATVTTAIERTVAAEDIDHLIAEGLTATAEVRELRKE